MSLPLVLMLVGAIWFFVTDGGHMMIGWFVFAAGVALQAFLGLTIACPQCGKSPYTIGPNWGPFGFAGKPVPDTICSRCGCDLRTGKSDGS
jgi:hypothetical protein